MLRRKHAGLENAIEQNNQAFIIEYIRKHRNAPDALNEKFSTGFSPLYTACMNGQFEIAALLVQAGANVNFENTAQTPLHIATLRGNVELVKLLLEKGASASQIASGKTALHHAAREGAKFRETTFLTTLKWDFSNQSLYSYDDHKQIIKLLLEHGADVDQITEDGITALHFAAYKGRQEIVECLLDYNAKIHQTSQDGMTAFLFAASTGHYALVQYLLTRGAALDTKTNTGANALHLIAQHKDVMPYTWTEKGDTYEVAELLIKNGLDINSTMNFGSTALHIAAKKGDVRMTKLLLKNGADVNLKRLTKNGHHVTALQIAKKYGHDEIIALIEKHIAVATQNAVHKEIPVKRSSLWASQHPGLNHLSWFAAVPAQSQDNSSKNVAGMRPKSNK